MIICKGLFGHAGFYLFDRTDTGWQVAHVVVIGHPDALPQNYPLHCQARCSR
jgi:hypothetical protein